MIFVQKYLIFIVFTLFVFCWCFYYDEQILIALLGIIFIYNFTRLFYPVKTKDFPTKISQLKKSIKRVTIRGRIVSTNPFCIDDGTGVAYIENYIYDVDNFKVLYVDNTTGVLIDSKLQPVYYDNSEEYDVTGDIKIDKGVVTIGITPEKFKIEKSKNCKIRYRRSQITANVFGISFAIVMFLNITLYIKTYGAFLNANGVNHDISDLYYPQYILYLIDSAIYYFDDLHHLILQAIYEFEEHRAVREFFLVGLVMLYIIFNLFTSWIDTRINSYFTDGVFEFFNFIFLIFVYMITTLILYDVGYFLDEHAIALNVMFMLFISSLLLVSFLFYDIVRFLKTYK